MGKAERAILELLQEVGSSEEIYQTDIVRQTGFSRSRISEVLSQLEEKGLISRIPLGKNFKVMLRDYERSPKEEQNHGKNILKLGMIRASEYPFVLPFEKALRDKLNTTLRFVIYDNGLDLSRDLSLHKLDLGIAPVLTHFVFFSIGSPIKMIAPAGSGGAAIIAKNSGSGSRTDFKIATTKLSTMELMLRSSIHYGDIPKQSSITYYKSPKHMMEATLSGELDAACIWEPYSTILLNNQRFKRLLNYSDLNEDHVCCAVAAGNHIRSDVLYRIKQVLGESLESYQKNPERHLSSYAVFMKFDEKLMRVASRQYTYPTELDGRKLAKQFERAEVRIPFPSSVKDAVLV